MENAIIYIHGKGGNAKEALFYKRFFPDREVIGFDYQSQTPWDAKEEFSLYFDLLRTKYKSIRIICNQSKRL